MPQIPQIHIGDVTFDIKDYRVNNQSAMVRNGSYGNATNPEAISVGRFVVDGSVVRSVSFETNRPLDSGASFYSVGIATLPSAAGNANYDSATIQQIDADYAGTTRMGTEFEIDSRSRGIIITIYESTGNSAIPLRKNSFDGYYIKMHVMSMRLETNVNILENKMNRQSTIIRNGSFGNASNQEAVAVGRFDVDGSVVRSVSFETNRPLDSGASFYSVGIATLPSAAGNADYDSSVIDQIDAHYSGDTRMGTEFEIDSRSRGIIITIYQSTGNSAIPLRKNSFDGYYIKMHVMSLRNTGTDDDKILKNAKNNHNAGATPALALLHFSDIHADTAAMNRITDYINKYDADLDDAICTGDMVANTSAEGPNFASWWNPNVMTCIGNHDTATYDASTGYDWTALSMANRDAYYIAPFESNWGISHTSGTSYYYKDYIYSKVRLIVMDAMLYVNNSLDALAQTSWLSNLLTRAIVENMHVLIAIHAPSAGATPLSCSFSKYNAQPYPNAPDCKLPSEVINAVSDAKNNGLHFIGYIVGHTHYDNIYVTSDASAQLIYTITCANTETEAQWKFSDQYRRINDDAINLVVVDTTLSLIRLIRIGGADIDEQMRNRKAICINYETNTITGELL